MKKSRSKSKQLRKQRIQGEQEEIALLNQWIEAKKPQPNTNPMALPPLPSSSPVGFLPGDGFSRYAGSTQFDELPLSKKTKDGLKKAGYVSMTKIQRASLPHSLCGRDILGAAKTGSGKTLAFVIPVLEKLYKERWSQEDGVGSIIISPTRELAAQLFDILQAVGKFHNYSAGLFIGGRHDVDAEKDRANGLNILVCTPGRLLQHMDETPNFDCSQLQVLVLDEADRILDIGFKKALNAIISQLPKQRQTMLFSATQTKSVQDLARLSLKDPEYVSVIEGSTTPTPKLLQQTVMEVALHEKMDMLWSFIKSHLNSRILVFLTSCKQVKFVFRAFKALHPGIPLKCLHGRMKQEMRMVVYSQFCEGRSVLFSTDVASRGLDFNKAVDWVVQFDCPEDVASYIHRAGRTARYLSGGKSLLFLMPSEMKMLEKLQETNIPIKLIKPNKKRLQPVSPLMSALLVKDEEMRKLAQRAFVTYLRSVHVQKDKEIFDVMKLPIDEFSASLGLPMTPKIRFVKGKLKKKTAFGNSTSLEMDNSRSQNSSRFENVGQVLDTSNLEEGVRERLLPEEESDDEILHARDSVTETNVQAADIGNTMPPTWVSKKKKLKININKPIGTKIVFDDDEDNSPPASRTNFSSLLELGNKDEFYQKLREDMKEADKEDKLAERQRLRDKRTKAKSKRKKGMEESEDELSGSEEEDNGGRKRQKVTYSDTDNDEDEMEGSRDNVGINTKTLSLKEQEAIALKLLESMHE